MGGVRYLGQSPKKKLDFFTPFLLNDDVDWDAAIIDGNDNNDDDKNDRNDNNDGNDDNNNDNDKDIDEDENLYEVVVGLLQIRVAECSIGRTGKS